MASELHPWITLLEGHDEGGEVNHRLQLVPGFVLGDENRHKCEQSARDQSHVGFVFKALSFSAVIICQKNTPIIVYK